MIDDVDPTFPDAIHPAPAGPDAGQDQQADEQELQIQKQVLAEFLPKAVDMQILDRTFPKHRARDDRLVPFEL